MTLGDFPGGPVVKNLPSNVGDAGLIPGQETKILQAKEQLSPSTFNTEARAPQLESMRCLKRFCMSQWRSSTLQLRLHAAK